MVDPLTALRPVRSFAALALAGWLVACGTMAPGGGSPAPGPPATIPPPSAELIEAHAVLLRLEDRRDADVATLQALAGDAAAPVRARTALALGRLRGPIAAALLPPLLGDPDTSVAATAAFALGFLADSTHADLLATRLDTAVGAGAVEVATEAAYALGRIGGATARAALARLLAEEQAGALDPMVAASALLAIWRVEPQADVGLLTPWLAATDPELRWRAAYALARRPRPEAISALRPALGDADARVRAAALRGIDGGMAGAEHAGLVAEVAALLADSSYEVAVSAARALGSFPDPAAVAALLPLLDAEDRHLAMSAAEALGRIGPAASAAAPVLERLATSDPLPTALRAAALDALLHVERAWGAAAASSLVGSPAWRIRAAAARNLDIRDPSLRALTRDTDPRVANVALQTMLAATAATPDALRPVMIEALGSPDPIVRATALGGLARAANPADLPLILDAYAVAADDTDSDAALAAIDALAALARPGLEPSRAFLTRFPRSDDPLVRRRAVTRLDSAAVTRAWGAALPIETGQTLADYRLLVDRFVVPGLSGDAPPEVLLITRGDTIRIRLLAHETPLTVENFLRLADSGYFDGQEWPRVVPNFVVQGGDPRGDTSGGPGYSIRDEITRRRYGSGTVGMALAGPDTGGSQFFITHSPQPHLDGGYTIFGEVVDGADVAERILPGDTIQSIRSVR